MKEKIFDLKVLSGNWESINLNPTFIIYQNGERYFICIIHINETSQQARPSTYEIQEDESGYFINYNLKRTSISYDEKLDLLTISALGDYMRN